MELERDDKVNSNDTRDKLIKIAARLFREKGYKATSLREIADLLGIQKASLYYYIDSKEQLLIEVTKKGMPSVINPIEEIVHLPISPREKLKRVILAHLKAIERTRDHALVALLERRWLPKEELEEYLGQRKKYEHYLQQILQEGIEQGEFPQVHVKITVLAILGIINWTNQWYNPEGPQTIEEIADIYVDLIVERMLVS